jgi:hypothetical protein
LWPRFLERRLPYCGGSIIPANALWLAAFCRGQASDSGCGKCVRNLATDGCYEPSPEIVRMATSCGRKVC